MREKALAHLKEKVCGLLKAGTDVMEVIDSVEREVALCHMLGCTHKEIATALDEAIEEGYV